MPKNETKTAFEESQSPKEVALPKYTDEELDYVKFLHSRLRYAQEQRDDNHDELDGMNYPTYYESNQKAAATFIAPRKNKEDTNLVTGVTREKKLSIMSNMLNLNLETVIRAYDEEDLEDVKVGIAMTDSLKKSEELEDWDMTMKVLVYDELTSQGNVFVEEAWVVEKRFDKKRIPLDNFNEETFKNFQVQKKVKEVFKGCKRSVIPGTMVYLGNIKEFEMRNQPYIFTKEIIPYEDAKAIYGDWPRFQNVPKSIRKFDSNEEDIWGVNFRVTENLPAGWVEVIKYQDKWYDEYQITLNGVMQLPIGFPLPWDWGEYNIVKGNGEPIHAHFAYCKGIPTKTKTDQQVLDEMIRLSVLKSQKSFLPPIANYGSNVLSKNAFLPGQVLNDVAKGDIEVVGGNPSMYQLNNGEISMINMLKDFINEKSIDPLAEGKTPQGNPTATEIERVSQQARIRLGLTIFGFMSLHRQLAYLRLYNILENWTQPIGKKVDQLKQDVINKYRTFSVDSEIEDKGNGERTIEFTEEFNDQYKLADREEGITRDEAGNIQNRVSKRKPRRILQVNPKALRAAKYTWYAEVTLSERETSLTSRVVFTNQITQAINLFGLQNINMDYVRNKWAAMNKLNPGRLFMQGVASQPPAQVNEQQNATDAAMLPKTPPQPSVNQMDKSQ